MSETVTVAHTLAACRTLGPGRRGVVWVQGCSRRCRGCVAGPILAPGGERIPVADLAGRILSWPGIDGVTFSGGEPFEQARGLAALCELLRRHADLSLMAYTGYTLEDLLAEKDPDRLRLVANLDILIDGDFKIGLQANLLWRGSRNQRILLLTDRHREEARRWRDRGAGVELHVRGDGDLFWAGVPEPRFAKVFQADLATAGVTLSAAKGGWT